MGVKQFQSLADEAQTSEPKVEHKERVDGKTDSVLHHTAAVENASLQLLATKPLGEDTPESWQSGGRPTAESIAAITSGNRVYPIMQTLWENEL